MSFHRRFRAHIFCLRHLCSFASICQMTFSSAKVKSAEKLVCSDTLENQTESTKGDALSVACCYRSFLYCLPNSNQVAPSIHSIKGQLKIVGDWSVYRFLTDFVIFVRTQTFFLFINLVVANFLQIFIQHITSIRFHC